MFLMSSDAVAIHNGMKTGQLQASGTKNEIRDNLQWNEIPASRCLSSDCIIISRCVNLRTAEGHGLQQELGNRIQVASLRYKFI
jgi:hypothetical protein